MDEISSPDYEFGRFRLDTAQQLLISPAGQPLPLPSRAFATLRYLVERSGEVVDKAALMATVWPTTVVSENNLNQCILALRKALGESAGERRFILTVPGRGYKFVAPVTVVPHERSGPTASLQALVQPATERRLHARWFAAASGGILLAAGAALWLWHGRGHAVTVPAEYEQLTDVTDTATAPVLSPDGHELAFIRNGKALMGDGQIWLKVLPDGEPVQITHAPGPLWAPAFTPDSAKILYSSIDLRHGTWDTWSVPVAGGSAATKFLPNAQALTYIGPREVLYSEFKTGLHLGVVTSLDDRSEHRDVNLPSHERGMAHFSYLSPDRKSVLVAEMGPSGAFERCRVVPFDGSSRGLAVGPMIGACLSAAWSPDGKWMYFCDLANGSSHIWRQRFPDGQPQQITFGPDEEQTVFATADGHSLLTSIGHTRSTLWLHNSGGERILTTEGSADSPWLSADAHRVYFLTTRGEAANVSLARMQIDTGSQESLVPGFNIIEYDISPDEQRVVFTTVRDGAREIWLAPLDRHASPILLVRGGDQPAFGGGDIFFRRIGEHVSYMHRVHVDGSSETRVLPYPMIEIFAVAPDGKAVVLTRPAAGGVIMDTWAVPIGNPEQARVINRSYSPSHWSPDGKLLYVGLNVQEHVALSGSTAVLPTGPDDLPVTKLMAADARSVLIPHPEESLSVGTDPSVYVLIKSERRQNIYRIPLH